MKEETADYSVVVASGKLYPVQQPLLYVTSPIRPTVNVQIGLVGFDVSHAVTVVSASQFCAKAALKNISPGE